MRRRATVTISVPAAVQRLLHLLQRAEAAGAGDQARGPPAAAQLPGLGAALDRRQDLDLLASRSGVDVPLAARDDLAVEGDGDAARLPSRRLAHRVGQRRPVGSSRGSPFSSILIRPPCVAFALRRGLDRRLDGSCRDASRSGASRMPLR
jgi:hypothetical protein